MHLRPGDEVLGVLSQSDTPPLALLGCMRLLEGLLPFYRRTPACLIVCLSPSLRPRKTTNGRFIVGGLDGWCSSSHRETDGA